MTYSSIIIARNHTDGLHHYNNNPHIPTQTLIITHEKDLTNTTPLDPQDIHYTENSYRNPRFDQIAEAVRFRMIRDETS